MINEVWEIQVPTQIAFAWARMLAQFQKDHPEFTIKTECKDLRDAEFS